MFLYNNSSVSCCRIMSLVPDEVRRCVCVGRVWRHGGEVTGLIGGPSRVEATGGTGLCVCSALGSRLLVRLEGQASMP